MCVHDFVIFLVYLLSLEQNKPLPARTRLGIGLDARGEVRDCPER